MTINGVIDKKEIENILHEVIIQSILKIRYLHMTNAVLDIETLANLIRNYIEGNPR